jgi:S1-C subfamily serine protease
VVTNYHVIEDAEVITVVMKNNNKYYAKRVLSYDKERDIAVLELTDAVDLPTVELGDSDSVEIADEVVAIGNPEGLTNTISTGIISGFRQNSWRKGIDFQISAPISHGSSGGALLNMYGKVIGITYAGLENGENLNFAIPINEVKGLLK